MEVNWLVITDIHHSRREMMDEARWFLRFGRIFASFKAKCLDAMDNLINTTLAEASKYGPYQGIIDLGDNTHGDKGEHGLTSDHAIKEAREARSLLERVLGGLRMIFLPGNHDIGWWVSFGSRWGYNRSSEHFKEIYGPLWGTFDLSDQISLIWLFSEPFYFDWKRPGHFKKKQNSVLNMELETQLIFLTNALHDAEQSGKKIVLAIHDPGAMLSPKLRKALDPYRDRLLVTLTGHIHARWLMNLINLFRPKLVWTFWKYKIQLIPSVWGVLIPILRFGAGGGWAILSLNEDAGELRIYHTNKKRFRGIRLK